MTLLNKALEYIDLNYSIFPTNSKQKKGYIKWKKYQEQMPTRQEVIDWWTEYPDANISIITGPINNITVVDIDNKPDKPAHITAKELNLPLTRMVKTGGGGFHYYYLYDPKTKTTASILPNVDIRSKGGQVVAPPSLHHSGNTYEWINPEEPLAPFPLHLFPAMTEQRSLDKDIIITGAKNGNRNHMTTQLIGSMLSYWPMNFWKSHVWQFVRWWNQTQNTPPLPQDELVRTFESIAKAQYDKVHNST